MQKVVITGASRGIGHATAQKFISEGFEVIGTSTRGKNSLVQLDLADPESIKKAARRIEDKWGSIDILINNAAIAPEPDTDEMDMNLLRQILEVNLIGTIDFTERLLGMITNGGHILNVSSGMGALMEPQSGIDPGYRISKTAINMYTKALASRLARRNIIVSSVDPGWVKTDMGGSNAPRDPKQPAREIFQLATSKVASGQFWLSGKNRPW